MLNRRVVVGAVLLSGSILAAMAGCQSSPSDPKQVQAEAKNDLAAYLREAVKDPKRKAAALSELDRLELELKASKEQLEAFRKKIEARSVDPTATKAELLALYDENVKVRRKRRARLLDVHFKLRETLTDEEWPGYVERELVLLQSYMRAPRTGAAAGKPEKEG